MFVVSGTRPASRWMCALLPAADNEGCVTSGGAVLLMTARRTASRVGSACVMLCPCKRRRLLRNFRRSTPGLSYFRDAAQDAASDSGPFPAPLLTRLIKNFAHRARNGRKKWRSELASFSRKMLGVCLTQPPAAPWADSELVEKHIGGRGPFLGDLICTLNHVNW